MKRKNRLLLVKPTTVQPPTQSVESDAVAAWQNLSDSDRKYVINLLNAFLKDNTYIRYNAINIAKQLLENT